MINFFLLLFWILAVCGGLALVLNLFLCGVILLTKSQLGFYKWVLIAFAIFESGYALCVFVGTPIHLVTGKHWIVISYGSILENTPLYFYGPAAYCVFWYMWICFIVFLFVYRYVVVCHNTLHNMIANSGCLKLFFLMFYFSQIVYSAMCGAFWCTRMPLTEDMKNNIPETFGIHDFSRLGYMLFGFRAHDNSISVAGTVALINHYCVIGISGAIIIYCTYKIWSALKTHAKNTNIIDVKLQRQLFYTLLAQTAIPFLMYHLPTMVFLTFPLWSEKSQFGSATPLFSVFTTIPKILDPIVIIIGIKDYRHSVLRLAIRLGIKKTPIAPSSSTGEVSKPRDAPPKVQELA